MAAPIEIPFNIQNLTFSNLTIDVPSNITSILTILPSQAASQSGFWFTSICLLGIAMLQYLVLADRSPFARFEYSDIRSLSICCAVTGSIGIWGVELGFFMNFQPVAISILTFVMSAIFVKLYEG